MLLLEVMGIPFEWATLSLDGTAMPLAKRVNPA